ncbi:protein-glutamate O-methyltransferase CheR [Methylomonas sp. SURF-2]|uniref:Chemotaxis protein methyltransferase n=1 Tax=Methylomonas subterranea TaxID=2952225 RepID=A0ABT1TKG6_9GAMM|nr:protein-glutamate O-methyltransferase CheR [Methylomonas sp. SURF-2]
MAGIDKAREFEYTLDDFNFLRKISNRHSGILVPDDKFDMFYSRLSKRVRRLGFNRFAEYCQYLQDHPEQEFTEFINAVTTNLTSFFREMHHFEFVAQTLLPELLKKNQAQKQIRVWSAGCSTGEEPYSLAMTLLENVPRDWDIKILATDLDTNVLAVAAEGVYPLDRVATIGEQRLRDWFQKGSGSQNHKVRIKSPVRQLIHFKQLNLMQDWPMKGGFDFIFCRNVLIYFDRETKQRLANRYAGLLRAGGYLFIGHSESLHQLDTPFTLLGNTIYQYEKNRI